MSGSASPGPTRAGHDAVIANLQALRAAAALMVVIFHFGLMPATRLTFTIGAAGVDIFFMLSGFIIAYAAARDTRHFLARRVIRVVPAYWIATAIAALTALPTLGLAEAGAWFGRSLLILSGPDGRPPLIFVAWTLAYELTFYLLYRAALCFGRGRAPVIAAAALLCGATVHLPGLPGPWPLLLEFAAGIGIFLLVERCDVLRALAGLGGLLIAAAGVLLLLIVPRLAGYDPQDDRGMTRVLCWGLPSAAIVLGALVAERGGRALRSGPILRLGAASYAIYLLHPIAIGSLVAAPAVAPIASALRCIAASVAIAGAAIGFHLWIEAPIIRRLRGLLHDAPAVEIEAGRHAA